MPLVGMVESEESFTKRKAECESTDTLTNTAVGTDVALLEGGFQSPHQAQPPLQTRI